VEAIILAGGRAERLGPAAGGRPKALVQIAGKPLAAYQLALLARAGVERAIVSCAAGTGELFAHELDGLGVEVVPVEEPEPLGRGGGIRFAAAARVESGDVYALNGDELLDIDLPRLLERHRGSGAAATITVTRPFSPFGVVELDDGDLVTGFDERARVPSWVSCGVYVLGQEALERFPEQGDHETSAFPGLVAEGRLAAFRYEGLWLTVNTPKDLRMAEDYLTTHEAWLS
jgi:NDP-sugar pyrophosphorylase family protein